MLCCSDACCIVGDGVFDAAVPVVFWPSCMPMCAQTCRPMLWLTLGRTAPLCFHGRSFFIATLPDAGGLQSAVFELTAAAMPTAAARRKAAEDEEEDDDNSDSEEEEEAAGAEGNEGAEEAGWCSVM